MHVQSLVKCVEQGFVCTDVGHDAQFNLAVIGTCDHAARRGDKGLANPPTLHRADGNILQIRVVARQAPRHRNGLRVMGVDPPRAGQRQLRQFVGVSAFEFGQATVFQNFGGQWKIFGQFLKYFFIGAGRTGCGFFDHG